MTPTARSLALLRREGWTCQVVERYCPHSRRRIDLFGIIDVVAARAGSPILGIQATSGSNHSARVRKASAAPELRTWLESGAGFQVWSWRKVKGRWSCRRQALTLEDLAAPSDCAAERVDLCPVPERPSETCPTARG